jgi:hypothetical protein
MRVLIDEQSALRIKRVLSLIASRKPAAWSISGDT